MTVEEVARVFGAKRIGKGKWIAKCTAHPDRKPSLSITEGKRWVLLRCWSQNCATEDILKAVGLTMEQLAYDSGRKATPEIRRRCGLRERRESLERQLGLVIMLQATDKGKRRYWMGAERRIRLDLFAVRWEMEPEVIEEEIMQRYRGRRA